MNNNKDEVDEVELSQLRWLIDQKLGYFKSFESRSIQLLGMNGIFLALIWSGYASETPQGLESLLLGFYILTVILHVFLFVYIGLPKKTETHLTPGSRLHNLKNMQAYFEEINTKLAKRARVTGFIYGLFTFQIILLILLGIAIFTRT